MVTPSTHYVKFTGKFRDLKGQGYRFWKAFGRNYRVYSKTLNARNLTIWQHHGGYFEVADLYELSVMLVELIRGGFQGVTPNIGIFSGQQRYTMVFDRQENKFVDAIGPNTARYALKNNDDAGFDAWYERYREYCLCKDTIEEIQHLLSSGQIEIALDNRKK